MSYRNQARQGGKFGGLKSDAASDTGDPAALAAAALPATALATDASATAAAAHRTPSGPPARLQDGASSPPAAPQASSPHALPLLSTAKGPSPAGSFPGFSIDPQFGKTSGQKRLKPPTPTRPSRERQFGGDEEDDDDDDDRGSKMRSGSRSDVAQEELARLRSQNEVLQRELLAANNRDSRAVSLMAEAMTEATTQKQSIAKLESQNEALVDRLKLERQTSSNLAEELSSSQRAQAQTRNELSAEIAILTSELRDADEAYEANTCIMWRYFYQFNEVCRQLCLAKEEMSADAAEIESLSAISSSRGKQVLAAISRGHGYESEISHLRQELGVSASLQQRTEAEIRQLGADSDRLKEASASFKLRSESEINSLSGQVRQLHVDKRKLVSQKDAARREYSQLEQDSQLRDLQHEDTTFTAACDLLGAEFLLDVADKRSNEFFGILQEQEGSLVRAETRDAMNQSTIRDLQAEKIQYYRLHFLDRSRINRYEDWRRNHLANLHQRDEQVKQLQQEVKQLQHCYA